MRGAGMQEYLETENVAEDTALEGTRRQDDSWTLPRVFFYW
jgi:hypothetical protein